MELKKILITGSSGFLGKRAVDYFRKNHTVIVPTHEEMDITDIESVRRVFSDTHPEAVIHCAAISQISVCEKEPERSRLINVTGSVNVAKAAGEIGAKCLLCSSDQVYSGSHKKEPHTEDETVTPANVYGWEKLDAERMGLDVNPDSVFLRLSWMYDPFARTGETRNDFLQNLLREIKCKKELRYPVHGRRGITCAWKVVENMEKALAIPGGIYNFGAENDGNTYETVKKLSEILPDIVPAPIPTGEAYTDNERNLCMYLKKTNAQGIRFASTVNGLAEQIMNVYGAKERKE